MVSDTMLSMILAQISTLQDRVDAHDERFVDTDVIVGNVMLLQTLLDVLEKHIESLEGAVRRIDASANILLLGLTSRVGRIEMHLGLTIDEDSDA